MFKVAMAKSAYHPGKSSLGLIALVIPYWVGLGLEMAQVFRVILSLASQIVLGAAIWSLMFPNESRSFSKDLGFGFAIGSLVFVAARQISLWWGLKEIFTITFVALLTTGGLLRRFRAAPFHRTREDPTTEPHLIFITLCGFGALLMGARTQIPVQRVLFTFVFLGIGLYLSSQARGRNLRDPVRTIIMIFVPSLTMVTFAFISRATTGGMPLLSLLNSGSDDVVFSEALANTLDRAGPFEHQIVDSIPLKYHWLSLAWSGQIQRLADLPPLTTTVIVVPTVGYLVIASLVTASAQKLAPHKSLPIFASIAAFLLSSPGARLTTIFVENTSNLFGHIWLLSAIYVANMKSRQRGQPNSLRSVSLLLFAGATALAKAPYAVVLVAVITFQALVQFVKRRPSQFRFCFSDSLAITGVVGLTYLVFLRQPEWTTLKYSFELRSLTSAELPLGIGLVLTAALLAVRTVPLWVMTKLNRRPQVLTIPVMLRVSPVACVLDVLLNSNSDTYFTNAGLMIASIGIAGGLTTVFATHFFRSSDRRWPLFAIIVLTSSPVLLYSRFNNYLKLDEKIITALVLAGLAVFVRHISNRQPPKVPYLLTPLAVGLSLVAGIGSWAIQTGEGVRRPSIPQSEELRIMESVRSITPTNAVVATNLGICGPDCLTADHLRMFLPALADRQPLVFWPRPAVAQYPGWQQNRIEASYRFASSPTLSAVQSLRRLGATHYLLRQSTPTSGMRNDVESIGAKTIFVDRDWILIELHPTGS